MFIKQSDDRHTYIIEGELKENNVFAVSRFICEIQQQQTPEETQAVADLVLLKLTGSWHFYKEHKPPVDQEVLATSPKWMGPSNPSGKRIGFLTPEGGFISCKVSKSGAPFMVDADHEPVMWKFL